MRTRGCILGMAAAVLTPAILATAPSGGEQPPAIQSLYEDMVRKPDDDVLFERFKDSLPHDSAKVLFVVEGDIRLNETQLRQYVYSLSSTAEKAAPGRELLLNTWNNKSDYWAERPDRHLTFAIDKGSFPIENEYKKVAENATVAAGEWNSLCPSCSINFEYRPQFDAHPSLDNVRFIVRRNAAPQGYVALGFYPHEAKTLRYLNVDPTYFTTTYNQVGVFRHELGHILGYRHEHIRGIRGCRMEGGSWRPLTKYDAHSVMHYFCGDRGSMKLELTKVDRRGHKKAYGE